MIARFCLNQPNIQNKNHQHEPNKQIEKHIILFLCFVEHVHRIFIYRIYFWIERVHKTFQRTKGRLCTILCIDFVADVFLYVFQNKYNDK